MQRNLDIREAAQNNAVMLWEIADKIGIADSSFSRKLRRELPQGEKQRIFSAIEEIAKDKLVIMVTHNPDLAKDYATRIIEFKDGTKISDSNPVTEKEKDTSILKIKKRQRTIVMNKKINKNSNFRLCFFIFSPTYYLIIYGLLTVPLPLDIFKLPLMVITALIL